MLMNRLALTTAFAILLSSTVNATPRPYSVSNRTAAAITAITAINNANPGNVIGFVMTGSIASAASSTATAELPLDECLFDLTFTLATTATIVQPDVDLCNIDGFVVE
jgi:hypothetical protein